MSIPLPQVRHHTPSPASTTHQISTCHMLHSMFYLTVQCMLISLSEGQPSYCHEQHTQLDLLFRASTLISDISGQLFFPQTSKNTFELLFVADCRIFFPFSRGIKIKGKPSAHSLYRLPCCFVPADGHPICFPVQKQIIKDIKTACSLVFFSISLSDLRLPTQIRPP